MSVVRRAKPEPGLDVSFSDYTKRLLAVAETIHRWLGAMATLDRARRENLAVYATAIAETLARAANAVTRLDVDRDDIQAAGDLARELGRVTGYVETVMDVLKHHLDGRKLAGVKRRLDQLAPEAVSERLAGSASWVEASRLLAAEGFFRALADGLRA